MSQSPSILEGNLKYEEFREPARSPYISEKENQFFDRGIGPEGYPN